MSKILMGGSLYFSMTGWLSFYDKNNVCSTGRRLEPLSAPQPEFKFGTLIFSNVLLLHKLLITGKGKQVVSRRAELDRDLLNKTCRYKNSYGITFSKVSCRHKSVPGVQSAQKSLEMMDFFLSFGSLYVPILQFCLTLIKRPLTPPLRENKMLFSGNMTSQEQDVHVF